MNNPKKLNNLEYENTIQYIPVKIYARIRKNAILTIVDFRVYMSVITKLLVKVLGLKWKESKKKKVISIDGKVQAALEEIDIELVVIADAKTWISLQVVNLASKTILLDTDQIVKYKVDIIRSLRKLRFQTEGQTIKVDMIVSEDGIVRDEIYILERRYNEKWHISEP